MTVTWLLSDGTHARHLEEEGGGCHCEELRFSRRENQVTKQSRASDIASLLQWPLFEIATSPQIASAICLAPRNDIHLFICLKCLLGQLKHR